MTASAYCSYFTYKRNTAQYETRCEALLTNHNAKFSVLKESVSHLLVLSIKSQQSVTIFQLPFLRNSNECAVPERGTFRTQLNI